LPPCRFFGKGIEINRHGKSAIAMKVDTDYLRTLLKAFQDADTPFVDVLQLREAGLECQDPKFIFHLQILEDKSLVQEATGGDLGYELTSGGNIVWTAKKLRLTAQGHEFIDALEKSEIWEIIKRDFKEEGIGTLVDVALNLAKGFAKERLKDYLNG
jgi:hypothetical protein